MKTATTTVDVQADVGKTQLALKTLNVQANVTPQTVSGLMAAFAPNVAGAPHLAGPSKIVLQVEPITVPLTDYKPQLDRAGQASIKLSLPGKTVVDGLVVANADGTKRDLGRVGVDSLEISVKAGVGALVGPVLPEDRKATVSLSGTVLGSSNEPMLELAGQVQTLVSDGKLAGALTATAKVDKINTRSIEQLAGQDGMLTGSLGNTASIELKASVTPPAAAPGAAPGAPFDIASAVIGAEVTLAAPNLHSDGPIKASITPTAIQIDKPVKLTLDADPAFINKMLEPKPDPKAKPSDPKPAAAVNFTDPASISLTISSLTFPRPGVKDAPPLNASVGVAIPSLKMLSSDKQAIHLSQLAVQVSAQPVGGGSAAAIPITLKMDVAEASVGDQPPVKGLVLTASVTDLVDAAAQVNTKIAVLSAQGDLPVVPTAMVDAMSKQNGTLVEALGPVVTLKVNIERYPLGDMKPGGTPPVIEVHATASRATAELRGTIHSDATHQPPEMIFVSETPIKVTILELTKAMAAKFIKGLPIIGSIEKTKQDAPGTVSASSMTVPLSDDMVKLNGDVLIDPGEARFGTSGAFATIVKSVNQKEAGAVGAEAPAAERSDQERGGDV